MPAFPHVRFLTSSHLVRQFPPDVGAEVAVAGRSNAGKSSAINAIVQRKGLAKTSKTPGATRLINFFELEPGRRLVDLPGYGFAAVPGAMRQHWGTLIEGYFRGRDCLRGAIVVMDVRHPLTDHDQTMLELAGARSVPVHIVLTKADKLGRGAGRQAMAAVQKAVGPSVTVQVFSALTGDGVAEARGALLRLLASRPQKETPVGPADPTGAS
ncbi:MAG: ribosome biogenesis GTP-binding protein YihA/YsxC [Steroidobacteraceae bacterium]|nr:ribosome biogenesis GTP-binding protein YihA/YsxC [Steroidobacteraceae bacterium]